MLNEDVSCQEKTGWLWKQGHVRKSWRRRWFVLRPTERTLLYFKKQEEVTMGKLPAGVIDLSSYLIEREVGVPDRKYCFKVTTPIKIFLIEAPDECCMQDWIDGISEVGLRVPTAEEELKRKEDKLRREEKHKKEDEEFTKQKEFDKQVHLHSKKRRLLKKKQRKEDYEAKKRAIKDTHERELNHQDEWSKLEIEQKEEKEDLEEKWREIEKSEEERRDVDPLTLKAKKLQKQLERKQVREVLDLQKKQARQELKLKLTQEDDIMKLQLAFDDEDDSLRERQDLDLKKMGERHKEGVSNKIKKNELELEKARDAIKMRREKLLLTHAQKDVRAQDEARAREEAIQRKSEEASRLQREEQERLEMERQHQEEERQAVAAAAAALQQPPPVLALPPPNPSPCCDEDGLEDVDIGDEGQGQPEQPQEQEQEQEQQQQEEKEEEQEQDLRQDD